MLAPAPSAGAESQRHEVLDAWLRGQAEIAAWAADVVQTRHLRSLVRPLETEGRVWFVQPNRFRWQLGDPPRTLAVRNDEELLIAYPRLRQLERYPLSGEVDPSWQQALALLDVGFPSDPEVFYERYTLIGATEDGGRWRFELTPASDQARRLIDKVYLEVAAGALQLLATELAFPDGSRLRNAFSDHDFEPQLRDGLLTIETGDDWQESRPLADP